MKTKSLKNKTRRELKRKPMSIKSDNQSCYPLKQSGKVPGVYGERISEKGMF